MKEIWKMIPGYNLVYWVSNTGRIMTTRFKGGMRKKIMPSMVAKNGYHVLTLCINSKPKAHYVHRIFASAFLPNPGCKPHVNHIDGNKLNNALDNLEWCTQRENISHCKKKIGTSIFTGVHFVKSRNKWGASIQLNSKHKFIGEFKTERAAALAHLRFLKQSGISNMYAS